MTARGGDLPDVPGRQLAVVHHGVGDDPDVVSGRVSSPAEVDVVPHQGQAGVESGQLVPDVTADQHARRADRQHRPVAVVLALVDLARLDAGEAAPGPVGGDTRLAQDAPVGRVRQLRPEDAPADLLRLAARSSCSRASGAGSQSSCSSQIHSAAGSGGGADPGTAVRAAGCCSARATAAPYPVSASMTEHRVLTEQLGQRGAAAILAAGIDADGALHGIASAPAPR